MFCCLAMVTALNAFNVQSIRYFHFRMLNRLNLLFNPFLLVKPVISAQGWDEFNQTCQCHLGDTCLGGVILSGLIFPLSLNNSAEDFPWIFVGSLILIMNFYSPGANLFNKVWHDQTDWGEKWENCFICFLQ